MHNKPDEVAVSETIGVSAVLNLNLNLSIVNSLQTSRKEFDGAFTIFHQIISDNNKYVGTFENKIPNT